MDILLAEASCSNRAPTPRYGLAASNVRGSVLLRTGSARARPVATRLIIDRRQHFELAWKQQQAADSLADDTKRDVCPVDCIAEVRDLAHLERIVEAAGSSVICLALYSRANRQSAGAVFLKHNIRNDFDDLTDIARLHRVRSVPTFVFFVGGSQVRRICMVDSRADAAAIRTIIGRGRESVSTALRQQLWRYAPSACK